jgi:phenylacetic acid degradation operon negative regulatory protein
LPSEIGTAMPGPERRVILPVGNARSLLLTVLSELVLPTGESVWTGALLHLLTSLGLEEPTVRMAIARAADAGVIACAKLGRLVRWTLTTAGIEIIEDTNRRALSLGAPRPDWDGRCLILIVTVPQQLKAARKRLYSVLSSTGFGNPAPGLWVNPHVDCADELKRVIEELDLQDSAITFIGSTASVGLSNDEIVKRAWALDDIAARYEGFAKTFERLEPEPGDDVLLTYVSLVSEWRELPFMDPQLPEGLLPNWTGRRAANISIRLREKWRPAATERWREIVELVAPKNVP